MYEYKVIYPDPDGGYEGKRTGSLLERGGLSLSEALNKYAKQGWRLVAMQPDSGLRHTPNVASMRVLIMEREVSEVKHTIPESLAHTGAL